MREGFHHLSLQRSIKFKMLMSVTSCLAAMSYLGAMLLLLILELSCSVLSWSYLLQFRMYWTMLLQCKGTWLVISPENMRCNIEKVLPWIDQRYFRFFKTGRQKRCQSNQRMRRTWMKEFLFVYSPLVGFVSSCSIS